VKEKKGVSRDIEGVSWEQVSELDKGNGGG